MVGGEEEGDRHHGPPPTQQSSESLEKMEAVIGNLSLATLAQASGGNEADIAKRLAENNVTIGDQTQTLSELANQNKCELSDLLNFAL